MYYLLYVYEIHNVSVFLGCVFFVVCVLGENYQEGQENKESRGKVNIEVRFIVLRVRGGADIMSARKPPSCRS